jgi:hypothetical protein
LQWRYRRLPYRQGGSKRINHQGDAG